MKEEIRPRQGVYAAGIFTLLFATPLIILFTVAVARMLTCISPVEDDSESDEEESEDRRKRRRKEKRGKAGRKRDRKDKADKQSKQSKKRREEEGSEDEDSEEEPAKSKPSPPTKKKPAPPPRKKPAPPRKKPPPPKERPPVASVTLDDDTVALSGVQVDEVEWHYMDSNNQQRGPVTAAQLREMFEDGTLFASTYVWCEDMDTWKELKEAPLKL